MPLHKYDLTKAVSLLPKKLVDAMKNETMPKIFVGGGFLRAVVTGELINDIDIFVSSKQDAKLLSDHLRDDFETVETDNAFTIRTPIVMQVIHRWTFEVLKDVVNSFDFSICCAAICWDRFDKKWQSYTHPEFYPDIAAKRITYLRPRRNEDAGGSIIRVLKYYQKGYRIPMQSLADVIARLMSGIDLSRISDGLKDEEAISTIVNGLLKEVDPNSVAAFSEN